ncbi:MFS transporter [Pseudonocardia ailaonensis]|uniref:MFS transporter n=1 Tax=Pseudonocardia ailaonensis TaxID=367279 RepID=A0ABN2NGR5_9PSEU
MTRTASRTRKEPIPSAARRAAGAGFIGTFIEYYDYGLYGVLTVYLAPLFFPASDPAVSLLVGLAVFGAGFVARPLGGILIGRLGDRRGRRAALLTSVLLMGACTGFIGLLPTYATVGVVAPIMLVTLRLGQGISAGAEMLGSVSYVLESAPRSRRGLLASLTPLGNTLGAGVGALTAAVVSLTVSKEAMLSFGWRIPFLVAVPLAILAFVVRRRIEDSPEFLALKENKQIAKAPLRDTFTTHWRTMVVACLLALGLNGAGAVAGWLVTYLAGTRGLPAGQIILLFSISMLLVGGIVPISGRLTDRYGMRRMTFTWIVALMALVLPLLWLLGTASSPWLLLVGMVGYLGLLSFLTAPGYMYLAELFPARIRFTASTFGQNVGAVVAGGVGPFALAGLFLLTGSSLGPAIWIGGAGVLTLVALALAPLLARPTVPPTETTTDASALPDGVVPSS